MVVSPPRKIPVPHRHACAAPGPRHPRATSTVFLLKKCQGTCAWSDVAGGPTSWEHRGRVPHRDVPRMALRTGWCRTGAVPHGTRGQGAYWHVCTPSQVWHFRLHLHAKRILRFVSRLRNRLQAWQLRAREHALQAAEVRTRT